MKVRVEIDGKAEELEIAFDTLTLRESVLVQREIGNAEWDDFVTHQIARPVTMLAVVAAKVKTRYPNVDVDLIDVDFITGIDDGLDPTETG